MKILTIIGARPQFIKAAAVSRAMREEASLQEVLVHTGQHYDEAMSGVFFRQLDIPEPKVNLGLGGGSHGAMTGRMLEALEQVMLAEQPERVLVYGDTNSTLAGALAAVKLHIPVAHVEAGLRSFNMRMPEEVNRILTDKVCDQLFCPTETAVANLRREGVERGVHLVGDVMYDASLFYRQVAGRDSQALDRLGLAEGGYVLATCHRQENTDDPVRLAGIVDGLAAIARELPVVLPLHPRTRKVLQEGGLADRLQGVTITEPLPFLDMVRLEQSAAAIVTDSGGVQKEAFFFRVPCLTLRDETEWVETVELGWNTLCGAQAATIARAWQAVAAGGARREANPYGEGRAAAEIVRLVRDGTSARPAAR